MAVFLFIFLGSALVTYLMPATFMASAELALPATNQTQRLSYTEILKQAARDLNLARVLGNRYGQTEGLREDRVLNLMLRSVQFRDHPASLQIRVYGRSPSECAQWADAVAQAAVNLMKTANAEASILKRAEIPSKPARPNVTVNLVAGAVIGAFLGTMAGGVGAKLAVGFDGKAPGGREATAKPSSSSDADAPSS